MRILGGSPITLYKGLEHGLVETTPFLLPLTGVFAGEYVLFPGERHAALRAAAGSTGEGTLSRAFQGGLRDVWEMTPWRTRDTLCRPAWIAFGRSNAEIPGMCRWLAYSGPPIHLDDVLMRPEHSLLAQSRHALEATFAVNADGFGIGWYTDRPTPGTYRDTRPAWNDDNLVSIAGHIESPLFFGHIRAAVGSEVVRTNCHPFRCGNWLFQHNGAIADFHLVKHRLDMAISPELYAGKVGQTDSETMFLLALTLGMDQDPFGGLCRMIEQVEQARDAEGVEGSFHMTVAATDGTAIYAARYASFGPQPSLYHSMPAPVLKARDGGMIALGGQAYLVVSEPLDDLEDDWQEIPENSRLEIRDGGAVVGPLAPA